MLLHKEFTFEAAHYLPKYHGKCENMHGHTYKLVVTLKGEPDSEGMIRDFVEVKKIVNAKVIDKLDHKLINDIIKNPSAENIATWVWQQLAAELSLYEVRIWETVTSSVTVRHADIEKLK